MASIERDFLKWLSQRAVVPPEVVVGIGDDAAIVAASPSQSWVVTTDTLAEGTHFVSQLHEWSRIGRKALAVSLSDLAAMGAKPQFALLNLQLPQQMTLAEVQQLFTGAEQLAVDFGVTIVGGDTNRWTQGLVISSTVIGAVAPGKHWPLGGAQVGDRLFVTGPLGGSILGRHLDFEPRCRLAEYLQSRYFIHAATDISDSLSIDLSLMAAASGLGVALYAEQIPIAESAHQLAKTSGLSPLDHALTDGEDFELLLSVSSDVASALQLDESLANDLFEIGEFITERGLFLQANAGARRILEPQGYSH